MDRLGQLSTLIEQLFELEREKEATEERLKNLQQQIDIIRQDDIPAYMDSINTASITTTDGWEVKVHKDYFASISEKRRDEAMAWLRENGFGDLIKNEAKISFNAGEDDRAMSLIDNLTAQGYRATIKETVHPQTLRAFVREQKDNGGSIPDDVFGVYPTREAKIKRRNQ